MLLTTQRRTLASAAILLMAAAASAGTALSQDVITHKELSLDAAMLVAQGALVKCHADCYRISLTILDNSGLIQLQARGDGTGLHTVEHSRRKAYTALTFKRPSAETAKAWVANPDHPLIEGTVGAAGGVPIQTGTEVIGAIGVSGAPGGDKDEACALAGVAKISNSLK
jgi:uncharacterized protein GlcG (DUF336 family)